MCFPQVKSKFRKVGGLPCLLSEAVRSTWGLIPEKIRLEKVKLDGSYPTKVSKLPEGK